MIWCLDRVVSLNNTPILTTPDELLKSYLKSYCIFSFYENQVALKEGRNYNTILIFVNILIDMKTKDKDFEYIRESIYDLNELIEEFIAQCNKRYDFLSPIEKDVCSHIEDYKRDDIRKLFNDKIGVLFEEFTVAHSKAIENKDCIFIEEILIEFNNFLSHFNSFIKDNKLNPGLGHIYRACLDGHKDIIIQHVSQASFSDHDILKQLSKLRIDEQEKLGKFSRNKDGMGIIRQYRDIAQTLTTLKAFDKNLI